MQGVHLMVVTVLGMRMMEGPGLKEQLVPGFFGARDLL